MKRIVQVAMAGCLGFLAGCVIIPDTFEARITIDIRLIEDQAEEFLDYVEGKIDTLRGSSEPVPEETSLLRRTLDYLSPMQVVYAADFKDSSPMVMQIAELMRLRNSELNALKAGGAVGESHRGLLELVKPELLASDEAKNEAQRLIAADNEDRKALYKEIARLNREQNLRISTVERVYAQKRLERAEPGALFQLPAAGEDFDTFKGSATGKRLGDACVPEAWVVIK